MKLSDAGESRVNGYLFVLERSLGTFLSRDNKRDIVREIESHLRDRIAAAEPAPDERTTLEKILAELGAPQRVAHAYAVERTVDEAVVTGRIFAIARAVWHVAMSTVSGFFAGFGLLFGYVMGVGFVILGALKPIFPDNIGVWVNDQSLWHGLDIGARIGAGPGVRPGEHVVGGYWVIPIFLAVGLFLLVVSQIGARRFLGWWRRRHPSFNSPPRSGERPVAI